MRPEDGRNTPVRQLKNVLLPAPLGPMTARISSRASSKFTWLSAVNPPKRTVRSSVRRIGAEAGPSKECAAVTQGCVRVTDVLPARQADTNLQAGGKTV